MIIGIDPGNTGAVAIVSDDGIRLFCVFDMPLMANGKKQQVNPYELKKMIERAAVESLPKAGPHGCEFSFIVEKVGAMPGQGVASMFNFGLGFGIIQGVIAGMDYPCSLVTPQKWKKAAGLIGKDKDNARTLAQRLYPDAPLGRKKDIGRADAILIARFGK
jgi:crossover junction endodeoxyribonuclease RuvC